MSARIHVSGITNEIDSKDLMQLFSKTNQVEEVYIPPKDQYGFRRNFAIIKVQVDGDDQAAKTQKINQIIRTFQGTMWKGMKLKLEPAKEFYLDRLYKEKEEIKNDTEKKALEIVKLIEEKKPKLFTGKLLKIRRGRTRRALRTCIYPKIKIDDKVYELDLINTQNKSSDGEIKVKKSAFKNVVCGCKRYFDEIDSSTNDELILSQSTYLPDNYIEASIKQAQELALANQIKASLAVKDTSKTNYKEPSKDNNKDSKGQKDTNTSQSVQIVKKPGLRAGFGSLLTDKTIKENDNRIDDLREEFRTGELDVDEQPSCSAEDISPEVLESERNRALQMALKLLQTAETKAALKPVKLISEPSEKRQKTKELSSNKQQQAISDKKEPITIPESKKPAAIEPSPAVTSSIVPETTSVTIPNNSFANLTQLKNIFHREEGIWWDDQHVTEIPKGEVASDLIFLEAEKLGIDVRSSATSNNASSIFGNQDTSQNQMKFSFFGDNSSTTQETSANDATNKSTTVESLNKDKDSLENDIMVNFYEPIDPNDLIETAKKFSRSTPLPIIEKNWKTHKIENIQLYKKIHRDAKRLMRIEKRNKITEKKNKK